MKKFHLLLLSVLSGLLFTIGWPVNGFPGFLFVAFVPLLFIEDYVSKNKNSFSKFSVFFYVYPAFFIWNLLTTYWIVYSTGVGMILAVAANSFFMAICFYFYHFTKRVLYTDKQAYFVLIFYWICFEYLHLDWDLSWTWLHLGNGFASYHKWIQWYEFTGAFGGTFWVIIVNIFIYKLLLKLKALSDKKSIIISSSIVVSLILVPLIISFIIYYTYDENPKTVEVVAIQPNIDPYNEQYDILPEEAIHRILNLTREEVDSLTDFVIAPESSIQPNYNIGERIWESEIQYFRSIDSLEVFVNNFPDLTFVIGASTRKIYNENEKISSTARKFIDSEKYYDAYNTAVFIETSKPLELYHKSKLTPGVEKMPFPKLLKPLESFAIDLGGTIGSLGIDTEPKVYNSLNDSIKIAAIICYESVYGEFVTEFVKNGANIIFVITNDGWWGNTPGHKQHLSFSVLRAVETRRSIARSANTGISAFINQRGDVLEETKYWVGDVIKHELSLNSKKTVYVNYGDYIGRICGLLSALFLLISISMSFVKRKNI
ncbi:MAG: apolipoprotein N-acyltransferase [Bacteroidales bacterium]|nr:apolipoprotein N-acyltransferase [Bacteroidales bacterium]